VTVDIVPWSNTFSEKPALPRQQNLQPPQLLGPSVPFGIVGSSSLAGSTSITTPQPTWVIPGSQIGGSVIPAGLPPQALQYMYSAIQNSFMFPPHQLAPQPPLVAHQPRPSTPKASTFKATVQPDSSPPLPSMELEDFCHEYQLTEEEVTALKTMRFRPGWDHADEVPDEEWEAAGFVGRMKAHVLDADRRMRRQARRNRDS